MHIAKVVIEGFKSFKEQTIFEFQPGLNVLVGHDEDGKSNLLYAIQFVLAGHQFQQLTQANLSKLLYSSSAGVRVKSAYVEIVVDNKDRSIREEGDEIRLRRIITSSKDAYTMNGQSISKESVMETLQSAKFSKANPYYIISHKKIQEICDSSTKKCVALLNDIARSLEDLKSEEESMSHSVADLLFNCEKIREKNMEEDQQETDRTFRHELLDNIHLMEDKLKCTGSDLKKIRYDFCRVASKGVLQGLESVWSAVSEMEQEEDSKNLAREYRGLVIEQFECPNEYMTAADAIAKNRLFHHVVDSNRVAIEIRKRMTDKKLPGSAKFLTNRQSQSLIHRFIPSVLKYSLCLLRFGREIFRVYSRKPLPRHYYSLLFSNSWDMMTSILLQTRLGCWDLVLHELFGHVFVCPTSKIARQVAKINGWTCVTLDGFVVHAPHIIPDGISLPNLSRFKLLADYKKACNEEKAQKKLLEEGKKMLKDIDSIIHGSNIEYQQMKTIKTFQLNRKAVQRSLKSLETEIASLQRFIELGEGQRKEEVELISVGALQKTDYLLKELGILKPNGKDLRFVSENLENIRRLNEKVNQIDLAVDSLKKEWKEAHQNVIKIGREKVQNQRPNTNNVNQELSRVKAGINEAIMLVDRAPFHLLDQPHGFSPHSQFIVTTLVPGLFDYSEINIIGIRFDSDTRLFIFQVEPNLQGEQKGSAPINRSVSGKLSET